MKIRRSRWLAIVIAMVMLLGVFSSCVQTTTKEKTATTEQPVTSEKEEKGLEHVDLSFMFFGEYPNQLQDVLDEFEERTKDTLNVSLKFDYTPISDYANKLRLKLSSGEAVDSAFDAPWVSMNTMISQKNYVELDDYFSNDDYPGLKKVFPQELLDYNKVNGKIYGIPFSQYVGHISTIYLRKDLREKYGLPEIKTFQDLESYYDKVLENEQGIIPFGGSEGIMLYTLFEDPERDRSIRELRGNLEANINLTEDGEVNVFFPWDPAERLENVPEPWREDTVSHKWIEFANRWYEKGYVPEDILAASDAWSLFYAGAFASRVGFAGEISDMEPKMRAAVPEAELEAFYPYGIPDKIVTDYKNGNFQCIPVTSKNVERTMMFYDWIFSDPENHDLLELGIEGKHWIPVDEDKYDLPAGVTAATNYNFTGYQLTWSPNMGRYPAFISDEDLEVVAFNLDSDRFEASFLAGFTFITDNVVNEMAKLGPILIKNWYPIKVGLYKDYEPQLEQLREKLENNGLETFRAEVKRQVEEFLATKE